MNKRRSQERWIRKRAREGRCPRGDYFLDRNTGSCECCDDLHQSVVAPVRRRLAFSQSQRREMPVVVMQPAKGLPGALNRSRKSNDLVHMILLDTGSIHAGIDIDEEPDPASFPRFYLLAALHESRDNCPGKSVGYGSNTQRVGAYEWISDEHIGAANFADGQQLE